VPWFKKHQTMISDADLPGVSQRYAQAVAIGEELAKTGYAAVGLDHYARQDDELTRAASEGRLRRNFQGYTTDAAGALLALGASAIGEMPQGFFQSARDTLSWSEAIERGDNPAARGLVRTAEDRMRAEIIERLMCDLTVDYGAIAARHGFATDVLGDVHARLAPLIGAGLAIAEGTKIKVPERHRLFLRSATAAFDAYFVTAPNRHAKAV
jgi:oxygen-independent coproporphyrinogen-3 oxidase